MVWKEIRNGEPDFRKITCSGVCKKCGKQAEVTSFFNGSVMHRMDRQKTYHFVSKLSAIDSMSPRSTIIIEIFISNQQKLQNGKI